jgi:hypothetical protein
LQTPSISRAAIPDRRRRGPSEHQIGPSPSQTAVGVHRKSSRPPQLATLPARRPRRARTAERSKEHGYRSFASHSVSIAIKLRTVARLTGADRRNSRRARSATVGKIRRAARRSGSSDNAQSACCRSSVALIPAILSVVVATLGIEAPRMSADGRDRRDRRDAQQHNQTG